VGASRVRAPGVPQAPGAIAAVARVALLCPDLLFGSRLRSALENAGHEVLDPDAQADVLVVDLTDDAESRVAGAAGSSVPVLGFYSHVEQDVRQAAEAAGFTRVVPRSRMAREGPALVESLLA
jgi:hypothetical protein